MMADNDGFHVVKNRGRRKKIANMKHPTLPSPSDDFDFTAFQKRLKSCIQDIVLSDFFKDSYENIISALSKLIREKATSLYNNTDQQMVETQLGDNVSNLKLSEDRSGRGQSDGDQSFSGQQHEKLAPGSVEILSYGLGNFTSCPIARYQLSFLIATRDRLSDSCSTCYVYDPMFSSHEVDALKTLGFTVISENEEGKRECTQPTVAFLPHCGKALYNNLLWTNLLNGKMACGLHNLVLVGNSFTRMVESTPERVLRKTGDYILKIHPHMDEVVLPSTFVHKDVFNDLSLHTFPKSRLQSAPASLWEDLEEPCYSDTDVEYIRK
ncbi:SRR1-like protein isoform X2 [Aplysia californica]|uniref:SRR1-like protein isoform X2 n=1 Tax=Aplysia californica TaxID=6500 RepID=A0ABM0JE19_APLCA|nr:SRR1-like protein isoform X2 [Aplysia californica]